MNNTCANHSSKTFDTYDLGCSAALICKGYDLTALDKNNPRKVMFIFEKGGDIEDVASSYWAGKLNVKARSYFDNIKMLKNRIYSEHL